MSKPLYKAYFRQDGNVFGTDHPEFHTHPTCERIASRVGGHAAYVEQVRAELATTLEPNGDDRRTVYSILRHVSGSGMSRRISLVIVDGGKPRDITYAASLVMGERVDPKGGIKFGGCGMDMGWHAVYLLGQYLWPAGTPAPHSHRNGEPDRNGGYALKHEWL